MTKLNARKSQCSVSIEKIVKDIQEYATIFGALPTRSQSRKSYSLENANKKDSEVTGKMVFRGKFKYSDNKSNGPSSVTGSLSGFYLDFKRPLKIGKWTTAMQEKCMLEVKGIKKQALSFQDILTLDPEKVASRILKGNDKITGSPTDDRLNGYEGNDILDGGKGNNTLTGGEGKDIFKITGGKYGKHIITDYNPEEDRIDLPGKPGKGGKTYSWRQKSKNTIIIYDIENASRGNYRMSITSDQPIVMDDIQFM